VFELAFKELQRSVLSMSMDFRSHCTLRCDRALNGLWIRLKAVVGFTAIIHVNTEAW